MRTLYRDIISAVIFVVGGVVMFAKLQSYSWWLIGSWKGALGVLAVLGLGILVTNVVEMFRAEDGFSLVELTAWLAAATVAIAGLFSTTSKLEFVWAGILIGASWLVQLGRDAWHVSHTSGHHYMQAG